MLVEKKLFSTWLNNLQMDLSCQWLDANAYHYLSKVSSILAAVCHHLHVNTHMMGCVKLHVYMHKIGDRYLE